MIEESGTVVALEAEGRVWVSTARQSACGGCQSESSCGSGVLAAPPRPSGLVLARCDGLSLAVGDNVVLGVKEVWLWRGLVILYVIPLVLLSAGGLFGQMLYGEPGAVAGALTGLAAGLGMARFLGHERRQNKYLPIVIKKIRS